MSKTINNGGPAFPCENIRTPDGGLIISDGMTMRDYFAAHAPEPPGDFMRTDAELYDSLAWRVRWRWAYADAMLLARGEA